MKTSANIEPRRSQKVVARRTEGSTLLPRYDPLAQVTFRAGNACCAGAHASVLNRAMASQPSLARDSLSQLQRQYGNRYVQRVVALAREANGKVEAAPEVDEAIQRARGGGQALDRGVRARMESAFGADFSGVRVHTDTGADTLNRAVDALAFTTGHDIFFRQGTYNPGSSSGHALLAHELTHVVQQGGSEIQHKLAIGQPGDQYEEEADRVSATVMQRMCAECEEEQKKLPAKETIGRRPDIAPDEAVVPSLQRQGGGAAPASHHFAAEGVSVVVRPSCAPAAFGFATVEAATRAALNAIFNTDCIEASRRTRIQRNLTAHGLDIRCRLSANLETPGSCAESTGFFIPANIFTLGSRSFPGHPDSLAACQPLESTILHEVVHLTRGFAQEALPASCEASCFGAGGGNPDLCRNIDVFGRRTGGP